MARLMIYDGDYLSEIHKRSALPDVCTVVEWIGNLGECRAAIVPRSSLADVPLKWKPFTMRGYCKCAELPPLTHIDMTDAITAWCFRVVENGQMILYATRAERDAQLDDEGWNQLRAAEQELQS